MASIDSVGDLSGSIAAKSNNDEKQLLNLGSHLEKAQKDFEKIVNDPNAHPGKLEAAKLEFEQQSQRFKAKAAMIDSVNRLIDDIIQRIGQIGR